MFIKNQSFKDEETLLDAMFDFNIGTTSEYTNQLIAEIDKQLEEHEEYKTYRDSLPDEDDKVELYTEERDLRLAEMFMERFDSFLIKDAKLYGVKDAEKTVLYTIDMV